MDQTASGILERLKAEVDGKYAKGAGSYVHDVLAPVAIEIETVYETRDALMRKAFTATASGVDLDAVLSQFGFLRKSATYAGGHVTVTGAADAVIRAGDFVAAGKRVYEVQETKTLTGGKAIVAIKAQRPGSDGNVPIGTVNSFPFTLDKITSVTNEAAISGGTDAETDEEYKERYYYFLDNPTTTGNIYDYEQWAREVDGVGLAKCYPLRGGINPNVDTPGTVLVIITTAEGEPAGTTLVASVKAYIEERRPVGASVTVRSAGTVTINISAHVTRDPSYNLASIQTQYQALLTDYFRGVGFSGGLIPYTKIGSILQDIPGVEYYSNLTVNGGVSNVIINAGELAMLGGVTLA